MFKNNLFYQRIYILTGERINFESTGLIVNIPSCYGPLFGKKREDQDISLNDVANLVNDTLSRKEEFGNANLDKWGRFDHDKSFLVQNGLDQLPIIDELILDVIKQLGLKARNIWPDGKKAAVCLTHDVDAFDGITYLWLRKGFWLTKSLQNFCGLKFNESKIYLQKIKQWHNIKRDPMFAFDRWMALEDRYGFRSTFFFMSLQNALSREGRRYSYRNPRVARVLKELNDGGWEIGLHAARYNNMDLHYLSTQKDRLEQILGKEIIGCRHHWLRVRFPTSWFLYEKAGFKYSSNMGWDLGYNGFRAGACFPYWPLLSDKNENGRLLEIPFQLMDSSIIGNPSEHGELFKDYLEKIKAVGGCLVLDFHQEYFEEDEAPGVNIVYKTILKILSEDENIFVARLEDVYQHLDEMSGK